MPLEYEVAGPHRPVAVLWLTSPALVLPADFEVRQPPPRAAPSGPRLPGLVPAPPPPSLPAAPLTLVLPAYSAPPGPGRCLLVRLSSGATRAMGHGLPLSNDLLRLRRRRREPLYAQPGDQGRVGQLGRVLASLRAGGGRLVPGPVLDDGLARCAFLLTRWCDEGARLARLTGCPTLARYLDGVAAAGEGPPARAVALWGSDCGPPDRAHLSRDPLLLRLLPAAPPPGGGDGDPSRPRELPARCLPVRWAPLVFALSLTAEWLSVVVRNPTGGYLVLMEGPLDPLWLEIFLHAAETPGGTPWSRGPDVWRSWR